MVILLVVGGLIGYDGEKGNGGIVGDGVINPNANGGGGGGAVPSDPNGGGQGQGGNGGGAVMSGGEALTGFQAARAWATANRVKVIGGSIAVLVLIIAGITAAVLLSTSSAAESILDIPGEDPIHHDDNVIAPNPEGGLKTPSVLTIVLFSVGLLMFLVGGGLLIKTLRQTPNGPGNGGTPGTSTPGTSTPVTGTPVTV